jgi:N-acetylmuramoyl-L-alanine amidase
MTAPRLRIDPADGRLKGPARITHNTPWPTPNCTPGGFGKAFGGVIHTEVGFEHSVIHEFNDPAAKASAFFSIGTDGAIHQYMPLGFDYAAWTQVAGNSHYRGVEHEDLGDPNRPLTPAQLTASAQVFEAMSAFDGWPLAPTDNPDGGRGIIFHVDGGAAWGGHDCPGPVRERQRGALIAAAQAIRAGTPALIHYRTTGRESLTEVAAEHRTALRVLLRHNGGPSRPWPPGLGAYLDAGNLAAPLPAGITLRVPA